MDNQPIEITVAEMSQKAVAFAKELHNISLDFSEESLELVEQILAQYYNDRPKGFISRLLKRGPKEEVRAALCMLFGSYIGEVIRKKWGGKWRIETKLYPGQQLACLDINGTMIFPADKVLKRITDGEADNVAFYYQVFKTQIMKAT